MWTGRWLIIFMVYSCLCLLSQCICQVSLMNQMAMMQMMMMKLMWPSSKTKEQFALWKGCYACAALTLACKNFNMPSSSFLSTCFSNHEILWAQWELSFLKETMISQHPWVLDCSVTCATQPQDKKLCFELALVMQEPLIPEHWIESYWCLFFGRQLNMASPRIFFSSSAFSPWSSAAWSHAPATSNLSSWLHFMQNMCWICPFGLAKILFQVPLVLLVLLFP